MAVVESFRATARLINVDGFERYMAAYYPAPPAPYRKVIDLLREQFGPEVVLESTSRICYLALNGDAGRQLLDVHG
jgi:hypothetical protein